MDIKRFTHNPFQENCYIVSEGSEAIVIDCGACFPQEEDAIRSYLTNNHLTPHLHLLTHAHLDHMFGARFLFDEYGLLPTMHQKDLPLFKGFGEQCRMFGFPLPKDAPSEAQTIGELPLSLDNGSIQIDVIETPGHTEGGVCYRIGDALFTGDTLFAGSIGRTDLPGGDYATLVTSLRKLAAIDSLLTIYPGHGPGSTLEHEKKYNPYL